LLVSCKALTIFRRSINKLRALIAQLEPETNDRRGACLDDSIRVGKNLYVGYVKRIEADGSPVGLSIPDKQMIPFTILKEYPLNHKLKRIWAGRFAPYELVTASFKGALYKCIDLRKLSACMIKRGRIYAAGDPFGRHVNPLLYVCCGIIPVPDVYLLFEYLGDIFLAMQLICGVLSLTNAQAPIILLFISRRLSVPHFLPALGIAAKCRALRKARPAFSGERPNNKYSYTAHKRPANYHTQ
jgi:hypothetical protein